MDIVAHNIANMNTAGFKGEDMMFVEHLVKSRGGEKLLGNKLAYARDISTLINFSEGPMEKTGNPLDLAITGDGFFVVRTPQGERYTRNGRFKLDEGGQLVVLQQNLTTSSMEALEVKGQPVRLAWNRQYNRRIEETGVASGQASPEEGDE